MSTDIDYDDSETISRTLIGRTIDQIEAFNLGSYHGHVNIVLDNGVILRADEHDGGCGCSNGCFDLTLAGELPEGVITSAHVIENVTSGVQGDGASTITLFVYTAGNNRSEIFSSSGGDNGYYGWGYTLQVIAPGEV